MKQRRYWTKKITIPIADDVDLRLYLRIEKGKARYFSIIFRKKFGRRWRMIKRCDNTKQHGGVPHCHIYKANGRKHREIIADKNSNLGTVADNIINDLQRNYRGVFDNYQYSK